MIRRYVRWHDCDGAGGSPLSPTDRPCSVCGTPDSQLRNMVVEIPESMFERLLRVEEGAEKMAVGAANYIECEEDNCEGECGAALGEALGAYRAIPR